MARNPKTAPAQAKAPGTRAAAGGAGGAKNTAARLAALEAEVAENRALLRRAAAVIGGLRVESQLRDEQAAFVAAVAALDGQ